MFWNAFLEAPKALIHWEIWLIGPVYGIVILVGLNFLAAGYTGPRSFFLGPGYVTGRPSFSKLLAINVSFGFGLYFLFVGPTMLFGSSELGFTRLWLDPGTGQFSVFRGGAALGVGMLFALLTRLLPVPILFSCLNEAIAMLSAITYIAGPANAQFVPGPVSLAGLGLSGAAAIYIADAIIIEQLFPRAATRTGIALSTLLVPLAVAPYVSWLRLANGL